MGLHWEVVQSHIKGKWHHTSPENRHLSSSTIPTHSLMLKPTPKHTTPSRKTRALLFQAMAGPVSNSPNPQPSRQHWAGAKHVWLTKDTSTDFADKSYLWLTHAQALLQPRHLCGSLTPRGECSGADQSTDKLLQGGEGNSGENKFEGQEMVSIYPSRTRQNNTKQTEWDKPILQILGSFHPSRWIGSCLIPAPPGYSWPVHHALQIPCKYHI